VFFRKIPGTPRRTARSGLGLVYGKLRHARSERGEGVARPVARLIEQFTPSNFAAVREAVSGPPRRRLVRRSDMSGYGGEPEVADARSIRRDWTQSGSRA